MASTVLTNQGRQIATGLLTGVTSLLPKYIALGSGSTDPTRTSTALTTEFTTGTWTGYARQAAAMSQTTVTSTDDTAKYTATFTAPGAEAVSEAGSFDASSAGNSFVLADFAVVNLAANDSITIAISVQLT